MRKSEVLLKIPETNLDCEKLFTLTIAQNILLDLFSILIIGAGIFFTKEENFRF